MKKIANVGETAFGDKNNGCRIYQEFTKYQVLWQVFFTNFLTMIVFYVLCYSNFTFSSV